MRKLINWLLLPFCTFSLFSCSNGDSDYIDNDYDGIYDKEDSDPNSNVISFRYVDDDNPELNVKTDTLVMDYRKFIATSSPSYDKDLGKLASLLISSSRDKVKNNIQILSSKHVTKESEVNAFMVQCGFSGIERMNMPQYEIDPYDVVYLYGGNHIMVYNSQKYQVFCFALGGYPTEYEWHSNFDLGSVSDTYSSLYGDHPDWLDKSHHKGFDVSANRAYSLLKSYIDRHKNNEAETVAFLTGQSRSGSVANLMGKRLADDNIRNLVYAINNPSPVFTSENDAKDKYSKYTNIFNINCKHDLLASFPFPFWGVTRYGQNLVYDFTKHLAEYNDYFGEPYEYMSDAARNGLFNCAKVVVPTRDSMYEFRKEDPELPEYELYRTYLEAQLNAISLNSAISNEYIAKSAYAEVLESGDEDYPYKTQYYTRPFLLFQVIAEVSADINQSFIDILSIAAKIYSYAPFFSRYVGDLLPILDSWFPNPNEVALSHKEKSCILGSQFAEVI